MQDSGIEVFVGVDMAKGEHFAQAVASDGTVLFSRSVKRNVVVRGFEIMLFKQKLGYGQCLSLPTIQMA